MSVLSFSSFFLGLVMILSTNSFVSIVISMEMMMFGIFMTMATKSWLMVNVHFFSMLIVLSVLEGALGLAMVSSMGTSTNLLAKGVWAMFV